MKLSGCMGSFFSSRPRRGSASPVAIRRGEGAQRKRCRDPRCSPRGNPANCQSLPQAELFVRQRERPGLRSPAVAWPPRLSAGRRESAVTLFSSCPQSFHASGSFPISLLFTSGGQRIGASARSFPVTGPQPLSSLGRAGNRASRRLVPVTSGSFSGSL